MRSVTRKAATIGATLALAMSGAVLAAAPASAAASSEQTLLLNMNKAMQRNHIARTRLIAL
ncbi:hypothetical protein ACFV84_37240 [Kitasatospora sp. NPDC059811]|uniref:hypothetical protein n=1 Tax=Streptomycetaceae TaxID=2062 RepID=UPI000A53AAE8|nr:hypothetical protein [Streptomyces sp. MJM8645]